MGLARAIAKKAGLYCTMMSFENPPKHLLSYGILKTALGSNMALGLAGDIQNLAHYSGQG